MMRPIKNLLLAAAALSLARPGPGAAQDSGQPVVLQNDGVRISIDPKTGAILSLFNRRTETEAVLPGKAGAPPFAIDVYSANQALTIRDPYERQGGGFSFYDPDSQAGQKGDLERLRAPVEGTLRIERREDPEGTRALCSCRLPGGIEVAYTIALPRGSPLSEWRIEVRNRGGERRREDRRVYRVAFPVLEGLAVGGDAKENFLARPFAQGELIPDPLSHDFAPHGKKSPVRSYVLTYIGWASMPWMDLYGARGGVYLASCDPSFQQVDLETWPDRKGRTLTLDLRTYAFLERGERWESQPFAVGIHEGDWHWAADAYRRWARAHHRPYDGPEWVRKDCDGWFGTGVPAPYESYPKMLEDARWLGLDYLQIWAQMLENVGPGKSRKPYYCFLLPDPDRGGEEAFARAVGQVRQAGGHIGFYHNIWTWDSEIEESLEQWKEKIPADVKVPKWWGGFRRSASVFPDGSRETGNYTQGYSGMCPVSKEYQDYVLSWVVDRYVRRYGADAWYFDSMPVTMFAASRACFSGEHGPGRPHGVGPGLLEIARRVSEAARPHVRLAITSETVSDALMQYHSHALGIEMVGGITPFPKPEIYSFTFPEHPIFSGTCNNQNGLVHYYPDLGKPDRRTAMNRVFLMGYRFDVLERGINPANPYHQHLRRLIALRKKVKSDIYEGEFRDDIGLGALPPRVEARLFRRRDGSALTIALHDRREEAREPFPLGVDLKRHDLRPPASASLLRLDGREEALPLAPPKDGNLLLEVPRLEGDVAAIRLRSGP